MQLNEQKFALAFAISFAIIWIICSALVFILPMSMMGISESMMHMGSLGMKWSMSFSGFFVGLFSWSIAAGISGWLIAFTYNRLL